MESKSVGVIGAGAWGSGLAQALARGGHKVQVWAREPDVVEGINKEHENKRYLPGYPLSENMTASLDIKEVASGKEFLILASPSLYLASTARQIADIPSIKEGKTVIGVLTKGFIESSTGPRLILETLEEVRPPCYAKSLVYIAGPSHAEEVAMGKITGLIAASESPKNSIKFRELLRVPGLMAYSSLDVIGVQICAAAKNVIAVVYGSLDAVSEHSDMFGDNAESLLLAAGLNETGVFQQGVQADEFRVDTDLCLLHGSDLAADPHGEDEVQEAVRPVSGKEDAGGGAGGNTHRPEERFCALVQPQGRNSRRNRPVGTPWRGRDVLHDVGYVEILQRTDFRLLRQRNL